MEVSVPILVRSIKRPGENAPTYFLRPVFFESPMTQDHNLGRGTAKLASALRKMLRGFCQKGKHHLAARCVFSPELEGHRLKLTLELRENYEKRTFYVVTFTGLDREIAFLPQLPDCWFEVPSHVTLHDRATEVLTKFFRDLEKEDDNVQGIIERASLDGKAWMTSVDLDVETTPKLQKTSSQLLAMLFAGEVAEGSEELENTGRNLDLLYPDDLIRSVCRDQEVEELTKLLEARDRRPVLVLGPRTVGKTSLIHESVFRKVQQQSSRFQNKRNTWLLSPQRLISGMSYVGQWENRLLAILKESRKKDHILYFDDLVGLFRAGVSRDSNLCVADVLKPVLEQRKVRILGEVTPAAFRVLRELDRTFADYFHIISLKEPSEDTSLRVLLNVIRRLERQYRCQFELDVLPTVIDLARRFSKEHAFPGQPALMLQRLASRYPSRMIPRMTVLTDFESQSGLKVAFLDPTKRLSREDVIAGIEQMMVGQKPAVEAAADVVAIAKARINDPERPWGCFLFLGPTGVGKTQCVKAIANELLGSPDRMIRFDMNEYLSAHDVTRLVGTLGSPEGLLTSAIRRQPYSVILLDEIEKAHPAMFDLLLQVLGEGRLTDALGRTADFRNAILILTSNLGSAQAEKLVGYQPQTASKEQVYRAAAEKFFRPEFLNRLDHIIPFDKLSEPEVREISRQAVEALGERDGFVRRKCILQPDDSVLDHVIARGFDPRWGARGVRRMIEKELLSPVALELSKTPATGPSVVRLLASEGKVYVEVETLTDQEPLKNTIGEFQTDSAHEVLEQMQPVLKALMENCQAHRPEGPMTTGNIRPEQFHYLSMVEAINDLEQMRENLAEQINQDRLSSKRGLRSVQVSGGRLGRKNFRQNRNSDGAPHRIMRELVGADDVHDFLNEISALSVVKNPEDELFNALARLALLKVICPDADGWRHEEVLLFVRGLQSAPVQRHELTQMLSTAFQFTSATEDAFADLGLESHLIRFDEKPQKLENDELVLSPVSRQLLETMRCDVIRFEGLNAGRLVASEVGTHLFVQHSGRLVPFQTAMHILSTERTLDEEIQSVLRGHLDWLEKRREKTTDTPDPLFALQPVLRIYDERGLILDLATGQSLESARDLKTAGLQKFLLARLPMPCSIPTFS